MFLCRNWIKLFLKVPLETEHLWNLSMLRFCLFLVSSYLCFTETLLLTDYHLCLLLKIKISEPVMLTHFESCWLFVMLPRNFSRNLRQLAGKRAGEFLALWRPRPWAGFLRSLAVHRVSVKCPKIQEPEFNQCSSYKGPWWGGGEGGERLILTVYDKPQPLPNQF